MIILNIGIDPECPHWCTLKINCSTRLKMFYIQCYRCIRRIVHNNKHMNFTRQSPKRGQTGPAAFFDWMFLISDKILVAILCLICNSLYSLLILLQLKCIELQALPNLWWPTVHYKAWTLWSQALRFSAHATIPFNVPDKDLIYPLNVIVMQYGLPAPFFNKHNGILFWPTVLWSHRLSCHESTDDSSLTEWQRRRQP